MLNPQYQLKFFIKCAKVREHTHASFWGSHIRITNRLNPQYQLKSSIKCAKAHEHTHASFWGSHIHITNMLNPQYQLTCFTLMGFQLHLHTATADAQPADRQRSTSATALNMARVQTHYPLPPHIRTKVYMHSKICNNIDLRMRETTCLSS